MERSLVRSRWRWIIRTLIVVLGAASGRTSSADLVASDSYAIGTDPTQGQYVAGTSLNNEPSNLANTGFANGGYIHGTGGTSNFLISSTGLASTADGTTSTDSGSAYWLGSSNATYASVARNLSTFNEGTTGTYWMSMLVSTDGTNTTTDGYVLSGFGNTVAPTPGTTSGYLTGIDIGFANETGTPGESDLVLRYRNTTGMTTADQVLVSGANGATTNQTYLVVAQVNINYNGSLDQVNYWVNPPDLNSVADLNSSATLASGTLNTYAYQGAATGTGDFTRLNYVSNDWNGATTFFDEQRLGTTLDSIAPAVASVPEPASLALSVLGGGLASLGWLWRRRRSSR